MRLKQFVLHIIGLLIIFVCLLSACKNHDNDEDFYGNNSTLKKYKIGFSQCTFSSEYRQSMNRSIQSNAMQAGGFEVIITDANDDSQKQIEDIKYLLSQKIDLLIVVPNEADALTPIVTDIYKSGLPVILLDRRTNNDQYTCFIGADNDQIGSEAAMYVMHNMPVKPKILEVFGQEESSAAIERHTGFHRVMKPLVDSKKVEFTGQIHRCDWYRDFAKDSTIKYIKENGLNFNVVFSHNDVMAIGVADALNELYGDTVSNILIVGIDGLPGHGNGIEAVKNGVIDATFHYPTGGEVCIETAADILNGKTVTKDINLGTVLINSDNALGLYEQMQMAETQQKRILRQGRQLDLQIDQISTQKNVIIIVAIFLFLAVVLVVVIMKLLSNNKRKNAILNEQNTEINAQKEELEAQSNYLRDINDALKRQREAMLGSIAYAQTIQNALLPTEDDLNYYFNAFVIYQPKDIVSGDFYYYARTFTGDHETHIIGVIDCTGHGVPGAFMSLIGINLLDQIIKQQYIHSPAEILDNLNTLVRAALRQQETENDDGMEAIFAVIRIMEDKKVSLVYEGAKFPLYHYNHTTNEIVSHKTARKGIGGKFRNRESSVKFEDRTIDVTPGDRIYLSSDGIGDATNADRKRYSTHRLAQVLCASATFPMEQQKEYVWNDLLSFKGEITDQRDDITVLGIEILKG